MNDEAFDCYKEFINDFVETHKKATQIPLGQFTETPVNNKFSRKVLLFSPHPDDECVVGALPLRLHELSLIHI